MSRYIERFRPEAQEAVASATRRVITDGGTDDDLLELQRLCMLGGLPVLLAAHALPAPAYDHTRPFYENKQTGPSTSRLPRRPTTARRWKLFDREIGVPIGVPASPLTANSSWIDFHAHNGFNVLTYKTVRNRVTLPYPWPNWVFLDAPSRPLPLDTDKLVVFGDVSSWPKDPRSFSTANSFGVPSDDPDSWSLDVRKASQMLAEDQILIVSVMGDYADERRRLGDIVSDFVAVALRAESAGAYAIELNLSCPNSLDSRSGRVGETLLGEDPVSTAAVVSAVADALRVDTRIILKLSYMTRAHLAEVIIPVVERISGISGINTRQWEVRRPDGTPLFPPPNDGPTDARLRAGVSGVAIRDFGLDFVSSCASIRSQSRRNFAILGMGGVMTPADVNEFLSAGADVVQSASAAFFNPKLAAEVHEYFGVPLPVSRFLRGLVLSAIQSRGVVDEFDLAAATALGLDELDSAVEALLEDGSVQRSERSGVRVYALSPGRRHGRRPA